MDVRFIPLDLSRIDTLRFELIALSYFSDERPLRGAAGLCDWRLCGTLSRYIKRGWLTGRAGEPTLLPVGGLLPFDKILLVGMGPRASFDMARFEDTVRITLAALSGLRLRAMAFALPGRASGQAQPGEAVRTFLAQALDREDLDEVVILDDLDAQRLMVPVVDAERRRRRAAREVSES